MRDAMTDGRLQVTAALALLENSQLVEWTPEVAQFFPVERKVFEFSWRKNIDPVFGRLICWINFSAGAEFLAKGVCLVHGIEIRKEQEVPMYPTIGIDIWAPKFRKNWTYGGTVSATNFGALGALTDDRKGKVTPPLAQLCSTVKATAEQRDLLFAAYDLLRTSIRNRDAHAYVPNVRDSHYNLVPQLFCDCFNVIVSWLPGGPSTLNKWRAEAKQFIDSL